MWFHPLSNSGRKRLRFYETAFVRSAFSKASVLLAVLIFFSGCSVLEIPFRYVGIKRQALQPVSDSALPHDVVRDRTIWAPFAQAKDPSQANLKLVAERANLIAAIDESLAYFRGPRAIQHFQRQQHSAFRPETVLASLLHFRALLLTINSQREFEERIRNDFTFFRSSGAGSRGDVLFTAYCQPEYEASFSPTDDFQSPLFRRPPTLKLGKKDPTRVALEGENGKAPPGTLLHGSELVYLRNRFEAVFIQIQGSARLRMKDGNLYAVGFDGATNYPFKSIASMMIRDRRLPSHSASMDNIAKFAAANPQEFDRYVSQNDRFIFFRLTQDARPRGSIGAAVIDGRSIATDKSLMPPGSLAIVRAELPSPFGTLNGSRFVLDHDTGSAIRGPGRVDFFVGSGTRACDAAGRVKSNGDLYYLVLKDPMVELAYMSSDPILRRMRHMILPKAKDFPIHVRGERAVSPLTLLPELKSATRG